MKLDLCSFARPSTNYQRYYLSFHSTNSFLYVSRKIKQNRLKSATSTHSPGMWEQARAPISYDFMGAAASGGPSHGREGRSFLDRAAAGHVPAISGDKLQRRADCDTTRRRRKTQRAIITFSLRRRGEWDHSRKERSIDRPWHRQPVFAESSIACLGNRNRHCAGSLVRDRSTDSRSNPTRTKSNWLPVKLTRGVERRGTEKLERKKLLLCALIACWDARSSSFLRDVIWVY